MKLFVLISDFFNRKMRKISPRYRLKLKVTYPKKEQPCTQTSCFLAVLKSTWLMDLAKRLKNQLFIISLVIWPHQSKTNNTKLFFTWWVNIKEIFLSKLQCFCKFNVGAQTPSLQTHHVYYMLKRCGNDRFYVVSTWNTSGVFCRAPYIHTAI